MAEPLGQTIQISTGHHYVANICADVAGLKWFMKWFKFRDLDLLGNSFQRHRSLGFSFRSCFGAFGPRKCDRNERHVLFKPVHFLGGGV